MTHKEIINKIDVVIEHYEDISKKIQKLPNYTQYYDEKKQYCLEIYPLICETLNRFTPSKNKYFSRSASQIIEKCDETNHASMIACMSLLIAVLKSLKTAYNDNLLIELDEIYHADIFNDFLEMGEYLLSEGYKDAAAVMIGGVIEDHLRKLCLKNSIQILKPDSSHIKMNQLVTDLYSQNVISRSDNKNLIAWLEIRNNAAHADYSKYNEENVNIMLQGVREFITRYPA
jgi:hypothetical protein